MKMSTLSPDSLSRYAAGATAAKRSGFAADSLLKYAVGVSAFVAVSGSARAASDILSFTANGQISTGPTTNFSPFTGDVQSLTGNPSSTQLALNFSAANLVLLGHTGTGYRWLGAGMTQPYSFTAGGYIQGTHSSISGFTYTSTLPTSGSTMYFGFINGANSNVGWASVTESSGSYFLTGFGMETGGAGYIQAGAVSAIPEPAASVALMALGALGIAALRRRNKAKAAANAA